MSKIIDSTDESETIVSDGEKELEIEEIFKKVETENGGSSVYKKLMWIRDLPMNEGCFESPIDINLKNAKEMDLPPLIWMNFETPPKKTKITNTGHTMQNGRKKDHTLRTVHLLGNTFSLISTSIGELMQWKVVSTAWMDTNIQQNSMSSSLGAAILLRKRH
uniref:Uncharacterized protein LOC114345985 isoform X2 n=1 Tax=Diabrotica virgifera virgifera TaxID=50390 RepID=A0A6P7H4I3_DIAVI